MMTPAIMISIVRTDTLGDGFQETSTLVIDAERQKPHPHATLVTTTHVGGEIFKQNRSCALERTPAYIAAEQALLALEHEIRIGFNAPFAFDETPR